MTATSSTSASTSETAGSAQESGQALWVPPSFRQLAKQKIAQEADPRAGGIDGAIHQGRGSARFKGLMEFISEGIGPRYGHCDHSHTRGKAGSASIVEPAIKESRKDSIFTDMSQFTYEKMRAFKGVRGGLEVEAVQDPLQNGGGMRGGKTTG